MLTTTGWTIKHKKLDAPQNYLTPKVLANSSPGLEFNAEGVGEFQRSVGI
jgi:hypothetical protein